MRDLHELKMIKASFDHAIPQLIDGRAERLTFSPYETALITDMARKSNIMSQVIQIIERGEIDQYPRANRFINTILERH